jgi:DNA replication and repair protein RecF
VAFSRIETVSYRNLQDGAVETGAAGRGAADLGAASVFLVGENGQGKTNFLDAVYTLCYGSSFRGIRDSEAACYGSPSWAVRGATQDGQACSVVWQDGIKHIRLNGKPVPDRKQLVETNPAVVFCHDDMDFARGEPERRRFFFDQTAGLVSAGYIDLLRMYRRILKARNAALKDGHRDLLDVLDIQLATAGTSLRNDRRALAADFDPVFAACYEKVSLLGERIGISYRPSWKPEEDVEAVLARLAAARDRELAMGTTLSGPHRDRYQFSDTRGDFSARASTGQLRLMALTLRIAQADYYARRSGRRPILLLDDVLLELDPEKRRRLMENLPPSEQSFFTFLPGEPYGDYTEAGTIVYWTDNGRFTRP